MEVSNSSSKSIIIILEGIAIVILAITVGVMIYNNKNTTSNTNLTATNQTSNDTDKDKIIKDLKLDIENLDLEVKTYKARNDSLNREIDNLKAMIKYQKDDIEFRDNIISTQGKEISKMIREQFNASMLRACEKVLTGEHEYQRLGMSLSEYADHKEREYISSIPDQSNQEIILECQYKGHYFKEFQQAYDNVLKNTKDYVYETSKDVVVTDPITDNDRRRVLYGKIKRALIPLLQAINYNKIFFPNNGYSDIDSMVFSYSRNTNMRDYPINNDRKRMDFDTMVSLLERILTDEGIRNRRLILSDTSIAELKAINLEGFKFNVLPRGFGAFTNLQSVFLSNTGINSLEPLNDAEKINLIVSVDNRITEITGLERLIMLEKLDIEGNPINKINPDFLGNHPHLNKTGGIVLSLPANNNNFKSFPICILHSVNESNGIIAIKSTPWGFN